MPATQATTVAQRSAMLELVEAGQTYRAVAEQLGVPFWTTRKWIRQGKRAGKEKLASSYGRPSIAIFSVVFPQEYVDANNMPLTFVIPVLQPNHPSIRNKPIFTEFITRLDLHDVVKVS